MGRKFWNPFLNAQQKQYLSRIQAYICSYYNEAMRFECYLTNHRDCLEHIKVFGDVWQEWDLFHGMTDSQSSDLRDRLLQAHENCAIYLKSSIAAKILE